MTNHKFNDGCLTYTVEEIDQVAAAAVLDQPWQDGYLALSDGEIRLGDLESARIGELAAGRVALAAAGLSGYLMEAGLWRTDASGSRFAEVCLEREDDRYLLQRWELDTDPQPGDTPKCFYRMAEKLPARKGVFKESGLDAIEVIMPHTRLHIYMTRQ